MSEATDQLRSWSEINRTQANVIRWLVAVGEDSAGTALSLAQADVLDATAEGWETIANAIEGRVADV